MIGHGGFDAIVGNPPFLGGKKVTGAMGIPVREWLVHTLASSVTGNADLVAYFFLRAVQLLGSKGALGLIATNSVAQGDTRRVGLDQIVDRGLTIVRSIQSQAWPSASASLEFAAVWGTCEAVAESVPRVADGNRVAYISPLLEGGAGAALMPNRLRANAGTAFQGCVLLGKGFVLDRAVASDWVADDPSLVEVVRPLLTGDDISSRPDMSASRAVIDFNDRSEEAARRFVRAFGHLEKVVKAERASKSGAVKTAPWWQFWRPRGQMREAISEFNEALVIARTSSNVMPVRVSTLATFGDSLNVFATEKFADQAALSSSFHQLWAITYGGTLETRVRYVPSDVFETFPLPASSDRLEAAGQRLHEVRSEVMIRRGLGLTDLYNLVNDPAVAEGSDGDVDSIRSIHVELDEAVRDAYGWSEVDLGHGFHTYRKMDRWTVSPAARVEILDRLLEENHKRAAAEGSTSGKSKGRASAVADESQISLFADNVDE